MLRSALGSLDHRARSTDRTLVGEGHVSIKICVELVQVLQAPRCNARAVEEVLDVLLAETDVAADLIADDPALIDQLVQGTKRDTQPLSRLSRTQPSVCDRHCPPTALKYSNLQQRLVDSLRPVRYTSGSRMDAHPSSGSIKGVIIVRSVVTPLHPSRTRRWRPSSRALRLTALIGFLGLSVALLAGSLAAEVLTKPTRLVYVARQPIRAGAIIVPSELAARSLAVPPWLVATLPSRPPVGARARSEISTGELIESSMLGHTAAHAALPRIAVLVPTTSTTPALVAPGNRVDIVATLTNPSGIPTTELVGAGLRILAESATNVGYLVTLQVPSYLTALALAQASATAKLSVIGTTSTTLRPSVFVYPPNPAASHG